MTRIETALGSQLNAGIGTGGMQDFEQAIASVTVITDSERADTISGTPGDDDITTRGGADTVYGGPGNDLITDRSSGARSSTGQWVTRAGDAYRRDILDGGDGDDTIQGGINDHLHGGRGNDELTTDMTALALEDATDVGPGDLMGIKVRGGEGMDRYHIALDSADTASLLSLHDGDKDGDIDVYVRGTPGGTPVRLDIDGVEAVTITAPGIEDRIAVTPEYFDRMLDR